MIKYKVVNNEREVHLYNKLLKLFKKKSIKKEFPDGLDGVNLDYLESIGDTRTMNDFLYYNYSVAYEDTTNEIIAFAVFNGLIICYLWVSKDYRGQGISKKLIETFSIYNIFCNKLQEKECFSYNLYCEEQLIPFYKHLGFTMTHKGNTYYTMYKEINVGEFLSKAETYFKEFENKEETLVLYDKLLNSESKNYIRTDIQLINTNKDVVKKL